jgi:hypothetical protein
MARLTPDIIIRPIEIPKTGLKAPGERERESSDGYVAGH